MSLTVSDAMFRFGIFAGVLITLAVLEYVIPRRNYSSARGKRWGTNITIAALGHAAVRLMGIIPAPLAALTAAQFAETYKVGLFQNLETPALLATLACILLLDLAIYFQHVLSHKIPILWRLHKVHHADIAIDVTTAVRFHPVEIALSMLYKAVIILLLGPSVFAVFLFEVILSSAAMFNHANITIPPGVDRILRLIIVTPDMHRVHHSARNSETDSNYGFNLSFWDYIFGTYISQPKDGHQNMVIGLSEYQTEKPRSLLWSLRLPFTSTHQSEVKNVKENT